MLLLICNSCGTGLKIQPDNYKAIDANFSRTYLNTSYMSKSNRTIIGTSDILRLFNIFDQSSDDVMISFTTNNKLKLSYINESITKDIYFDGKFTKRGCYEIYLTKKKVEIPPFFPIIYSDIDIDRIRLGLTKQHDLIIDNYAEFGGNIFILAGGHSIRSQYYFKKK